MPKLILIVALVAIAAFVYFTPGILPQKYHQTDQSESVLLVMNVESGSLANNTLTLKNPDKHLVWFSDRPERNAGRTLLTDAVAQWNEQGLNQNPPNAALSMNKKERVVLTITNPHYDPKTDTLTFQFAQVGDLFDLTSPVTFEDGTLFIDSVGNEVQVLNNLQQGAINASIYKDSKLLATKED